MADQQLNLGQLGSQHKYELAVTTESPEDAAARRERELRDALYQQRKDFILFVFTLVVVLAVFACCVYLFLTGSVDDKKWAYGVIAAIVSGLLGYLVGQRKE